MRSRSQWSCVVIFCGLGLAACAANDELAGQPGLLTDVKTYYDRYAIEEGGLCHTPEFRRATGSSIEEQTADRLVVRVSYIYSDPRFKSGGYTGSSIVGGQPGLAGPSRCRGFSSRSFTIAKRADGFDVLAMTGPQHRGIEINKIDRSNVW
jgi:hypothetical protein